MGEDSRTAMRIGGLGEDATQKVATESPSSLASMRAAPPPGTLIGRHVVERVIGRGGMGIVLAARQPSNFFLADRSDGTLLVKVRSAA